MSGESMARTHSPEQLHPDLSSRAPIEEPARTGSSPETSRVWAASHRTRRFFIQFKIGIRRTAGACQTPAGDLQVMQPEQEALVAAPRSMAGVAMKSQAFAVPAGASAAVKPMPAPPLPKTGAADAETAMFVLLDIGTTVSPPDGGQPPYH